MILMKSRGFDRRSTKIPAVSIMLLMALTVQMPCHSFADSGQRDSAVTPSSATKENALLLSNQDQNDRPAYQIPNDPDHLLLQWDMTGGFRAPLPPDFEKKPNLQIYADGRVIAGANSPDYEIGRAKLSAEQLKELFDFIVVQQKFFETSEADIRRKMEGYRSRLADGLTSTFQIELEDLQQSIAVYALSVTARDFKEWEPIQRLKAVEQKLRRIKVFADAGGAEGVQRLLDAANAELKKQDVNDRNFTMEHLTSVNHRTDGRLLASFSNSDGDKPIYATVQRATKKAELTADIRIGR